MTDIQHPHESAFRMDSLCCVLILSICIAVTHPVAEIGLNDDWSYIRTAQLLATTGHVHYNGWATAMLGWQLYLGALFIKLFGFSFTITRASTLLVSLPGTYLLHRVMMRFGLDRWNAVLGTMTVVLSPVFFPIVFSFMSDVSGFFCIVLCLYACQRAIQSASDRSALLWLCFAAISNVLDGTVRQIAWIGVLALVPATAWILRKRKGLFWAGAALWILGVIGIYAFTVWFGHQPYSIPEEAVPRTADIHLLMRFLRSLRNLTFSVLLYLCPILVISVPGLFRLSRSRARIAFVSVSVVTAAILVAGSLAIVRGRSIGMSVLPWMGNIVTPYGILRYHNIVGTEPLVLPIALRASLSLVVWWISLSCVAFFLLTTRYAPSEPSQTKALSLRETTWLLLPLLVGYVALLTPRAISRFLIDRYLPPLILAVAVMVLRYLQERNPERGSARISTILSCAVLLPIAFYGVAGTHDVFSLGRARAQAAETIQNSGVPRSLIEGGMEYDGWTQLLAWGYINEPHLKNPTGAYHPMPLSQNACQNWFLFLSPAVTPKYVLSYDPNTCYLRSSFAPVAYSTWLPPYGQRVYTRLVP